MNLAWLFITCAAREWLILGMDWSVKSSVLYLNN